MRIFISADIEGVAGVVHGQQGHPGIPEYETARRLMTQEVNAAVDGAFAGGASEVLVNDSHGQMRNLILDDIDSRARIISGRPKPMLMMQGLEAGFAGAMLIGYHARAGARGVLAHTINGFAFAEITLNDRKVGEADINGALAGALGVPIILLSGDDMLKAEIADIFPDAHYAEVKRAIGANCADSLSPQAARALIRDTAEAAVAAAPAIKPYVVDPPYRCAVRLTSQLLTDVIDDLPMVERQCSDTVLFECRTVLDTMRTLAAMSSMSSTIRQ